MTDTARPSASDQEMHLVAPRRSVARHLTDLWEYRELLRQLVRRELKVKYKGSALGFAWSLFNPAAMAGIYYVVFVKFLGNPQPDFHIWILSGLLIWQFFATSLIGGALSVVGNSYLVGKVRFPREVLPLAAVGAALVHFFLQLGVLFVIALASRYELDWAWLPMMVPALVVCVVLASGLAILFSTVNVYARDTQHLLELVLQIWFWLSCVIVSYAGIGNNLRQDGVASGVLLINPMTSVVITMQRAIYGSQGVPEYLPDGSALWYLRNLAPVFVVAVAIVVFAIRVFDRAEGNFAEML
jgi:ABC-2 type transport system permease protein